jgi:hypothetical protein
VSGDLTLPSKWGCDKRCINLTRKEIWVAIRKDHMFLWVTKMEKAIKSGMRELKLA